MNGKSFKRALLLILMLTMATQLFSEELPFLLNLPEKILGPDALDAKGKWTSRFWHNTTLDAHGNPETDILYPWFKSIGFTMETTPEQAIRLLVNSGIVYIGTEVQKESDATYIRIYGFLKDNPLYSAYLNYTLSGKIVESGFRYHKDLYTTLLTRLTIDDIHKEQFERLSDVEKYACAFSSNLASANSHSLYTFALYDEGDNCVSTLSNGWSITDRKSLLDQTEILLNKGHHGSYNRLKKLYEDNAPLSVLEIAQKYMLDNIDIMRLFFIEKMKDTLGEHGIEAWDYGRAIIICRWGLEAGYITRGEALLNVEPFVERLRASYSSWEDFMAHYIAGRAFWTLQYLDVPEIQTKAINYCDPLFKDGLFTALPMEETETNTNPVMSIKKGTLFYEPDEEAANWNRLWDFFSNQETTADKIWETYDYTAQYPDIPAVRMMQLREFFNLGMYSQSLPLFREADPLFQPGEDGTLPDEATELFTEFWYDRMIVANNSRKGNEALYACDMLEPFFDDKGFLEYERALSYTFLIGTAATDAENSSFAENAVMHIKKAVEYGYDVPESLLNYLGVEL